MKIAKSVIAGSDGDEDRVAEYMKDVCAAGSQEAEMCKSFASGLEDAMIGDSNYNREKLSLPSFCKSFWAGPVQAEAEEKKAADEKAAVEKAAADNKAAQETAEGKRA